MGRVWGVGLGFAGVWGLWLGVYITDTSDKSLPILPPRHVLEFMGFGA